MRDAARGPIGTCLPERRSTAASVSPLPAALRTLAAPHRRSVERWWARGAGAQGAPSLLRRGRRALGSARVGRVSRAAARARWARGGPASVDDAALHHEALYEYWGANPELTFSLEERRFHICHAHEIARGVWRRGVIPVAFRCPRRDAACPFARASACANGRDVLLLPRLVRTGLTRGDDRVALAQRTTAPRGP